MAQIKQDINRSGWESTDFPSVCETCLPENPYVKMIKEDHGAECKVCTRPYTVFAWSTDRAHGRKKRTNLCLTCARLKNCCQCCMLDLSFGLPLAVRDAALKMVAPAPSSDINREYYAQNNERAIEDGTVGVDAYEKTDEKARDLLQRLAHSKPYFRGGRALTDGDAMPTGGGASGSGSGSGSGNGSEGGKQGSGRRPGPVRTTPSRDRTSQRTGTHTGRPARALPPVQASDYAPPSDPNVMSLFVTGIEDDLAEFRIREFFQQYGKLKSLVCSHMSHCAFVNYETRAAAERAAATCQGKAVIAGCPLRIRWGVPKAVGTMNKEQRSQMLRDARPQLSTSKRSQAQAQAKTQATEAAPAAVAPPPGSETPQYESLAGE